MDLAFDELSDKAKETADKAKGTAADILDAGADSVIMAKDAAVDMIDVGKSKLQEGMVTIIEETNKLIAILQNSGFRMIDISVTVSLPPRVYRYHHTSRCGQTGPRCGCIEVVEGKIIYDAEGQRDF